jgi:hypothetical protein
VLPANAAMRAVPLGAGAHQVELRYRPGGLRAGLVSTVIGLLVAAALMLLRRRA